MLLWTLVPGLIVAALGIRLALLCQSRLARNEQPVINREMVVLATLALAIFITPALIHALTT